MDKYVAPVAIETAMFLREIHNDRFFKKNIQKSRFDSKICKKTKCNYPK